MSLEYLIVLEIKETPAKPCDYVKGTQGLTESSQRPTEEQVEQHHKVELSYHPEHIINIHETMWMTE